MSRKPKTKAEINAEQLRIDSIRAKFLELDDEEDEVKYQTIVEYCIKNKTCFHDGEFLHCDDNLGKRILKAWKKKYKVKETPDPNYPISKTDKWYRVVPQGPKSAEWTIWHPWNIPYEIFQSRGLGNCGFIAALSAISAHKSIVEFVFRDLELSEHGVYQLRLCKDGEWKIITIDDWIPCIKGIMKGASLKATGGIYQIWPALIEKATAKACGGYKALYRFCAAVAMSTITGAPSMFPCIEQYTERVDEFWRILKDAGDKKYLMSCGTREKKAAKRELKGEPKIALNHAFTILTVLEIGSHRMLRLRNPWGRSAWEGKWSEEWTGWTDEMILKLHVLQKDVSGAYWIEFEDFVKYFRVVSICRWRADWYEIRLKMVIGGLWDGRQKNIWITVPKACEISVTAILPGTNDCYYHTWISIYEANASPHEQQILYCAPVAFSTEDVLLQPGDYIIIVSKFYHPAVREERNVVIHSSIPISARFCDWDPMKMVGIVQKTVEEKGREVVRQRDDVSIKKYEGPSFVVAMAQNYSWDRHLHVHTRISRIEGAKLSRGQQNVFNAVFGDVIPPRSSQILLVAFYVTTKKKDRDSMSIEYGLSKEKVTKVGRKNKAAHIPKIEPTDYIHHTIVME
ncbi:hypothetical protein CAEBREN_09381 [Caenorhabditis brenneri]|uniref:Calpain catalytic domain-containing protein n=1 Tax=Caenorhabditis brenneri TaxID=135651 RepID=G0NC27_CAEBE|nr:hypothetical protein CAEBREN_09381 [Caenorhabditis brenneri]